MSQYTPPQAPTHRSSRYRIVRAAMVLILTIGIAACSILMVGPQVVVIVPLALALGFALTRRRSQWSTVCFGCPFTFGLISAWIGYKEMPGYEQSMAFAVSVGIGLIGCALIAVGLWKVLPGRKAMGVG